MSVNIKIPALIAAICLSGLAIPGHAKTELKPVEDISLATVDEDKLRHAMASRTLSWLTGSSSNNDYVSVGRLANFFGFVALRVSSGHSLSRGAVAKETLHVLNKNQQAKLIALVDEQKDAFQAVQSARFEMNRALEGLLVDETVTYAEFLKMGEAYGAAEAELGRVIGQTLGEVATTLSLAQTEKLSEIRQRYISGQRTEGKIKGIKTKLSKSDKKELINIAARLLSWKTGNETYNDFEVVGKPSQHFGFVSLRIESNHGVKRGEIAKLVMAGLTPNQQNVLDEAAAQNVQIFESFMSSRKELMRHLEVALSGQEINRSAVRKSGEEMGRAEAEMTWLQAMAMLDVRNSMTEAQLTGLLKMRKKYTGGGDTLPDDLFSRGRQLYSQCALCHNESGPSIGPELTHIVGKDIAEADDYSNYSAAMKTYAAKNTIWTEALLDEFLTAPKQAVPGTYMGYDGIKSQKDRDAIITYIRDRD